MDIAEQFDMWKQEFRMRDDGLNAFKAIKKLEEVTSIVALRREGWQDELEAALS